MEFRYVSSVKGHLATRYGTGTPLGAVVGRDEKTGESTVVWNEDAVIAIPLDEWNRHIKEYTRLLTHGALKERKPEEHKTFVEAEKKTAEADAARVAEEAKKAADEAKKNADATASGGAPTGDGKKGKKE